MRNKRYSKANAISDRSGFKFPMKEMVIEPGTGWLVHKSESDGMYSEVMHPLNNVEKYIKHKQGDPFPVPNARPRPSTERVSAIPQYTGQVLFGVQFYLHANYGVFEYAMVSMEGVANMTASIVDWNNTNNDWSLNGDWQIS